MAWMPSLSSSPFHLKLTHRFLKAHSICTNAFPLLIDREWMLPDPAAPIHRVYFSDRGAYRLSFTADTRPAGPAGGNDNSSGPSFYIVRDDLLHPLANGNKARKLDAILPVIQRHSATDVLTCGGCQSAHAAAVGVYCAERGIRSHLLLRGEQPRIPTGYNLVSLMYGNVKYVSRSEYVQREELLIEHARALAGCDGSVVSVDKLIHSFSVPDGSSTTSHGGSHVGLRRVAVVNEGAGNVLALLGFIRLVKYLSQANVFGENQQITLVVDAGTGTTAVGLAMGAVCLGLPWNVKAVMLVDVIEKYKDFEKSLTAEFKKIFYAKLPETIWDKVSHGTVNWIDRVHQRKFGKVLPGEIDLCRQIAQETGILLDPLYTLAAWEQAVILSVEEAQNASRIVMLHTGGTLGLFGVAQRYAEQFYAA
ncbi:hypothetical protein HPP92_022862 [Vanilla planifolia]|uniref:Tryptophan synthase beta chain-like PALP domain-containing protein n=1 Tax=Vanilla planifolia TaxID=51239 RepID=A0A835PY81_VANPL|nr:hypothetical protein HPP92_022862 [Vanilla planifolia]